MTSVNESTRSDNVYRYEIWSLSRIFIGLAAIWTWIPRGIDLKDTYSSEGIVITTGPITLTKWFVMSPAVALLLWLAVVLSGLFIMVSRRTREAACLFLISSSLLLTTEGLNIKAYDRIIWWLIYICLFAPVKRGDPDRLARFMLMLLFCNLYLSTGLTKLVFGGNDWLSGKILSYSLTDYWFGGGSFSVWLSGQKWLLMAAAMGTVVFEVSFSFFILFKVFNPWILLLGILFHLGIACSLKVNTFSLAALSAYPVLLHPQISQNVLAASKFKYSKYFKRIRC